MFVVQKSTVAAMCWSVTRVAKGCVGCTRYDNCTYPIRRRNLEFDAVRYQRKVLINRAKELEAQMKTYE